MSAPSGTSASVAQRQRSRTSATRPRSSILMLSNMDRRLSLGEQSYARHLLWEEPAASEHTASSPAMPDHQISKRKRLAVEMYETEKAYVRVLMHVDKLYYTPLLMSLQDTHPILSRSAVNRIFANFYDILQLSKELLFRLEERIGNPMRLLADKTPVQVPEWDPAHDTIGDLLVPILPFLKVYALFMQNFSHAMQCIESERRTNDRFRVFLAHANQHYDHESPHGVSLGLEAQLLNIVQRVPRYRMLLRSLLQHTPVTHKDHAWLAGSFSVVDHIARSVNEHIRQHELTMTAIALQRTLIGLDEPLVVPGRRLLKHGTLLKTRRKDIQPRHFYLFSDCMIVAAASSLDESDKSWPRLSHSFEGELSDVLPSTFGMLHLTNKLHLSDVTVISYDDMEVPLPAPAERPVPFLRHKFEILSPQCSFSLYAPSQAAKHSWVTAIREAQDEFRTSLPSIRKSLELSERPSSFASMSSEGGSAHGGTASHSTTDGETTTSSASSRTGHTRSASMSSLFASSASLPLLEEYHAPVWVPDSLVSRCKRCSEPFSFWRRKHHCRLCGYVFCATCCSRVVLVRTESPHMAHVRARVCIACYTSNFRSSMPCSPRTPSTSLSSPTHEPPSPTWRGTSLRPMLHTVPASSAQASLPTSMPTKAVLQSLTNTPIARKSHRRQWSIVSVPREAHQADPRPRVQVETKTTGLPTLDQHIPSNSAMPTSASMPALASHAPPPRRSTSRETLRASQAVSWLQSLLPP